MAYTNVEYTRKQMADALMTGATPKLKRYTAGSQRIPGYGDVFAPINEALRKKAEEDIAEIAEKARWKEMIANNLDKELGGLLI